MPLGGSELTCKLYPPGAKMYIHDIVVHIPLDRSLLQTLHYNNSGYYNLLSSWLQRLWTGHDGGDNVWSIRGRAICQSR